MLKPVIDYKKCEPCRVCIEICPVDVFSEENGRVIVKKPEDCIGCRACEVQCPKQAIKVVD